jgi:hypothetical protein
MSTLATQPASPTLAPYASQDFNESLWYELKYLAADVGKILGKDLIAVVLGGGFGRSEGCVTLLEGHEAPYNDVDLFLVTRSSKPRGLDKLKQLAERYEDRLKIAVDFSRPQTLRMLARWQPLLMWQELLHGHQVLCGPGDILTRNVIPMDLHDLPLVEASRLMLNRGAGLLWACRVQHGMEPAPDNSFITRNYFKCAQGLADAALIALNQYCSDPVLKAERLGELAPFHDIIRELGIPHHLEQSRDFRRTPHAEYVITQDRLQALADQWCRLFVWCESKRLNRSFQNTKEYCDWTGRREPGTGSPVTAIAAQLRRGHFAWQHPRETVYRSLPLALQQVADGDSRFEVASRQALCAWREAQ